MLKLSEKPSGQTGEKVLLEAMSKDKVHLARFILDALDGKIINSTHEGAVTPLITAARLPEPQARSKFMTLLLQRGASVNHQDERGRTALSHACEHGYLDAVKVLVQNNADPELVDSWGNTALMYASVGGHSPVVDFLVRAFKRLGLEIDRQNKVGNSAVEVAKYLGHQECFSALTSKAKKGHDNGRRFSDSNEGEDSLGRKSSDASEGGKQQIESGKKMNFGIRRFDDSYYQKRSSLPTSVLAPTPPERALIPQRKSKALLRNPAPGSAETPAISAPGASFTILGNRLLRRFTFPELRKSGKDPGADGSTLSVGPELTGPGMPKSETFPPVKRHPQVGSKPSVDSISAVKCEFDFHFKMSPNNSVHSPPK
ncbi:ankyrin repeat domain-containing protein 63-like [Conger conger]|uniref:ankyrin repeat domain-containing protein 63-like n=1 Tax=Conger conger TaxID=82655 RepID=UPI002A59C501|nr:ankyrin repeat domain-containing protein 63-like [Conger conger]